MKPKHLQIAYAILCLAALLPIPSALAATWTIHADGTGDFPTIQDAVYASSSQDVIELASGTFSGPGNTDVFVPFSYLTIRSASGFADDVIIDCQANYIEPRRGIFLGSSQGTVIEGITITGGYGSPDGGIPSAGALLIYGSSQAVVRDCVFVDNHAGMTWDHAGGAVYVDYLCSAVFENCEFRNNSGFFGGAVAVNHGSQAEFTNCRFLDNQAGRGGAVWGNATTKVGCLFARNTADEGGAVWSNGYNEDRSINCTYSENSAPLGGGLYVTTGYGEPVTLIDTIVANSPVGEGVWAAAGLDIQFYCSDLYGNAGGDWIGTFAEQVDLNGNFSANPCFCDPELDDYQLCANSYCLPGHHPWGCDQLVGAFGQGCGDCSCDGPVATDSMTWGSVKSIYR